MAIAEQVELLRKGPAQWNEWRRAHPDRAIDLTNARFGDLDLEDVDLRAAKLKGVRLRWAYMRGAKLAGADIRKADLSIADLSRANLQQADLTSAQMEGAYVREANLDGATLSGARLVGVNFDRASLRGANLSNANLRNAVLVDADMTSATLTGCRVYGASVWNACLDNAEQSDLVITHEKEGTITVDRLDVAQFMYLLLNNRNIRHVIDTVTSKVVLILGRFTPQRKPLLDVIRTALRRTGPGYVPVLFDFEKPAERDFIETVSTIAHLARFVIADVTDSKIVLEEIPHIVRTITVPLVPLLLGGTGPEPVTLYNLRRNHRSLMPTVVYTSEEQLLESLSPMVVLPAEEKARELRSLWP